MVRTNKVVRFFQTKPVFATLIVLILSGFISAALFYSFRSNDPGPGNQPTFTVKQGPLTISVTESGTLKAREQVIIKNEVEGKSTILWLIPEGAHVKKGDLLVELEVSQLLDKKVDQQIKVQNDQASFINARENLKVVKNQAQSDTDMAKLTLDLANMDLKKYIEGEYPNELKEAEAKITLAKEELTRAEEQLKWSKTLFQEKYLSQTELQADELAAKKKALDLELAKNNLDLLKNFTYQRNLAQFKSDVKQAQMALERAKSKAKAGLVQTEADLKAKKSEFERQENKLTKIEKQIEKSKIYAPADGIAIYASSANRGGRRGREEPLAEGQEVRERQELIHLPTGTSVKAEIDIHESSLKKVSVGLPVKVTVDALPGKIFTGRIIKIAPLPDAQSMWMNPDLKVYTTEIYLDGNSSFLRTGMSCRAEIIIEEYQDALYIPIQAVLRIGGAATVYVLEGKNFGPRKVEAGLNNNRMVQIVNGLQTGEKVLLTPPLAAASVESSKSEAVQKGPSEKKTGPAVPSGMSSGGRETMGEKVKKGKKEKKL